MTNPINAMLTPEEAVFVTSVCGAKVLLASVDEGTPIITRQSETPLEHTVVFGDDTPDGATSFDQLVETTVPPEFEIDPMAGAGCVPKASVRKPHLTTGITERERRAVLGRCSARYGRGVDEEPRNAASEHVRLGYQGMGDLVKMGPEGRAQLIERGFAEGFVREDRRRSVAAPPATAEEMVESMLAYWDTGAGPPAFSVGKVVAVRGERTVLFVSRGQYENGFKIEDLIAAVYSPDMKNLRTVRFDVDAVEDAIVELDRLYEIFEAEPPAR